MTAAAPISIYDHACDAVSRCECGDRMVCNVFGFDTHAVYPGPNNRLVTRNSRWAAE